MIEQSVVLRTYLPLLVFLLLATGVGTLFLFANTWLGPRFRRRPTTFTHEPYECGLPSEVQKNFRFGISFYLVAILFLIFDLEVVLLYPVAVELDAYAEVGLIGAGIFIVVLLVAFVYEWRRGALEWK